MTRVTFEKAMSQLEQIVQDLESGDMPLEKALKKFEEGVKLSRYCEETLDETEARIALLTRGPGAETTDVCPEDLNSLQGEK